MSVQITKDVDSARQQYSINIESAPPLLLQRIPGGSYTMGSATGLPYAPEGPEHAVEIKEFWMSDTPVTRQQFQAVMGYDPSYFRANINLPVETVTWIGPILQAQSSAQHVFLQLIIPS